MEADCSASTALVTYALTNIPSSYGVILINSTHSGRTLVFVTTPATKTPKRKSDTGLSRKIYDGFLKFGEETEKRRRKTKVVTHASEAQMGDNRETRAAYLIAPELGYDLTNLLMFKSEIGAGKNTGKHRHTTDAAIYILEGAGHSIVADERYEWAKGDAIYIPSWTWHQHFNPNKSPVSFIAATTNPLMRKLGLFMMEQAEEAKL